MALTEASVLWVEWTEGRSGTRRDTSEKFEIAPRGSVYVLQSVDGKPVVKIYNATKAQVERLRASVRANLTSLVKDALYLDERNYTGKDGQPKVYRELLESGSDEAKSTFSLDVFDDDFQLPAREPQAPPERSAAPPRPAPQSLVNGQQPVGAGRQ